LLSTKWHQLVPLHLYITHEMRAQSATSDTPRNSQPCPESLALPLGSSSLTLIETVTVSPVTVGLGITMLLLFSLCMNF
jgi:hypothetical protein